MKTGIELISEERKEQLEKHGWTPEHDDHHDKAELAKVAAVLCCMGTDSVVADEYEDYWCNGGNPWGLEEKLMYDRVHRLKVAGALIAAEIDRIKRNGE